MKKIDENLQKEISDKLQEIIQKYKPYETIDCEGKVHCIYCPLYLKGDCILETLRGIDGNIYSHSHRK